MFIPWWMIIIAVLVIAGIGYEAGKEDARSRRSSDENDNDIV